MPQHRAGGPVPTASRQGREKQKYDEDGSRLVAGSIPVRFKPGMSGPEGVEVLLISSRRGKGQVFPKGGWEVDEELREAAMRETVEEAGVRGELEEPIIGKFPFHSGKAERQASAHGGRCVAYLFAMHVTEVLPGWPEAALRKREWCSLQEACSRCRYDWMREALIVWIQRQGWEDAAAACRACALQAQQQQEQLAAQLAAQQTAQQAAAQLAAQEAAQQAAAQPPAAPQPQLSQPQLVQQAQAQLTSACAPVLAVGQAVMATGGQLQVPGEASVPSPIERIAVRT